MSKVRPESKKKIVQLHIQEGRTLSSLAAEYVLSHPIYPEYVSQHTIDALYQSYLNAESKEESNELFDVSTFKQIKNILEPMCEELATPLSV